MNSWIKETENPLHVFKAWFELAQEHNSFEPTSMTLATVDALGMPSARVVLLKKYDDKGFCFFTNYESEKSKELVQTPKAGLCFHWPKPFHRQVRVRGLIEKLSYEESDAYFQTRARGSKIGAWASPQSRAISGREELQKYVAEIENKFADKEIPCPQNWGGFRLLPLSIEFWQSQDFRLHDRIKFSKENLEASWQAKRLAP